MRNLRQEYIHAQNEVKRIASIPLMIGHFLEGIDPNTCIVAPTSGQNYYVRLGFIRLSFWTMLTSVDPWLQNFIDGRSWKIETIRSSLSSQAFSFAGWRSSTRIWFIYSGFSWNYFRRIILFDKSLFSSRRRFDETVSSVNHRNISTVESWLKTSQMWRILTSVVSILRNKARFQSDSDWLDQPIESKLEIFEPIRDWLKTRKKEIREAVELPLTHMNMYKAIGIDPPRNHSPKTFRKTPDFSMKYPLLNGYKEAF